MFHRMQAAIARAIGRDKTADRQSGSASIDIDESADIDFRSLDPGNAADEASGSVITCPVTRQELKPTDVIYQCRTCRTAYSKAGWEFLRDVNRGRCCTCGLRKTVSLLL